MTVIVIVVVIVPEVEFLGGDGAEGEEDAGEESKWLDGDLGHNRPHPLSQHGQGGCKCAQVGGFRRRYIGCIVYSIVHSVQFINTIQLQETSLIELDTCTELKNIGNFSIS